MSYPNQEIGQKRKHLHAAQAELDELRELIRTFGALVDARLGDLLDQLSELNSETAVLDRELRTIREKRLYGEELIRYLDGAPRPQKPLNLSDLPPLVLHPTTNSNSVDQTYPGQNPALPDIKTLYRQLARLYHPDLARNEADRVASNEHMAEINHLYQEGDLPGLMKLAGLNTLPEFGMHKPFSQRKAPLTELEKLEAELSSIRQEITRLSSLPLVKLSLDVKLARHQRRDLLSEMSADLQRKVQRKIAERDYLTAQINASRSVPH